MMEDSPHAQPNQTALVTPLTAEALLDTLPWGVVVLDAQGIIQRVNQQAARWLGPASEALLGRPLTDDSLLPAVGSTLMKLLEPGAAARELFLAEQEQWVVLTATRHPGGWVVYGQDITPQKQREQQYQALADNTPDVLTRWTPDLRLRYANAALATKTGQPLPTLLGCTFAEMGVPADVAGPYQAALGRVFATGQPQEHYNAFATPHGPAQYYSRLVPELHEGEVETVLGIARDITALRQSQAEALRLQGELAQQATDQYHALFRAIDQGFCVLEVLVDDTGQQAVDFRCVEANPAFVRQAGLPAEAPAPPARALLPGPEPFWLDTSGRVALTGEAVRLEHYVPQVNRWFDVHAFPLGPPAAHRVAVLCSDITARKQAAEQLRRAAEADAFRLQLADALGSLAEPAAMQEAVTHLARQHFGADHCHYGEIEGGHLIIRRDAVADGMTSVAGTYPLADFALAQAALAAGRPFCVRDVRQDAAVNEGLRQLCAQLHIVSYLNVPVVKHGQPAGVLCLVQNQPRAWTAAEETLATEVAERTWAAVERGRAEQALRESEVRRHLALETAELGTYVWHAREDRTEANARLLALFGRSEETHATFAYMLDQGLHPDDRDAYRDVISRAMDPAGDGQLKLDFRVVHPDQSVHWMTSTGQAIFEGQPRQAVRIIGTVADITARKQAEEHQAFLLRFSDALRAETSASRVADQALEMLCAQLQLDRCYIGIYDLAGDRGIFPHQVGNYRIPPLPAEVRLSDFPAALRVAYDQTLLIDDLTQTAGLSGTDRQNLGALGLRALVAATLRRGGAGPQWAVIALSADARHWTPGEVALLEEATERIWAAMERARAEAALQASQATLAAVFEALPVGVGLVDKQGQLTLANRQMQYYLPTGQMPSLDDIQHPRWQATHPDGRPLARTEFPGARALRGETVVPGIEMLYTPAEGPAVWTQVIAVPLPDGRGQVAGQVTVILDIDARKRAEQALQVSEAKYRTLFETMDQGFGIAELLPGAGPDGQVDLRWLEANPQFEQLTGMARAEVLSGQTVRQLVPGLEAGWFTNYEQVVATGVPVHFEQPAAALGRWFDLHAFPIGEPAERRVAVLFTNITARKQAEEALRRAEESYRAELEQQVAARTQELRESRNLLRTVFDASPTAIVVMRLLRDAAGQAEDFEILIFNEFNKQVVGHDDIVGKRFTALFPNTVPTGILARLLHVATTGEPADFEQWYEGEGMRHWFRHIVVRQDGLLVLTSEVITARKTAEQERLKNLRLLEQAEAVAQMGSWDYDLRNRQFLWSAGMYQLFGLPLGQVVRPEIYLAYVVAEDRPLAEQLVARIKAGTESFETALRLRVGEQVKTARIKAVVMHNEAGQPVRVLGVDLDITELQRLEADNLRLRLGQQRALFEAVQQAQEEERRRMSESLHNGIGQILYATKLQLDRLPDVPELAGRHEAARLLADAIRQTRSLSHELTPAILEEFGLEKTLLSMCRTLHTASLQWNCHFEFEPGRALPLSLQLAVYRLAQELVQNVLKHAQAVEATLEVEVLPNWVVLRVEDNGRGFDPARTSDGLGLRTLRSRVELMGGSVHLTTAPSQGTQCLIRLPLAPLLHDTPLFSR